MILETTFMGIITAMMLALIVIGLVGHNMKVKREKLQAGFFNKPNQSRNDVRSGDRK